MSALARYAIQALLYGAFIAVIGYFSTSPAYTHLAPNEALVKLSFSHGAQPKHPCRERSAEELAKLSPNMRAPMDCRRERSSVIVELDMDNRPLVRLSVPPAGLAKDGPATLYRRLVVSAGKHTFAARLSDQPSGAFNYSRSGEVELKAGRVLVIDFVPAEGGFMFKG